MMAMKLQIELVVRIHETACSVGEEFPYVCSVAILLIWGIDSWIGVENEYDCVEVEVEDRGRRKSSMLAGMSIRKIRSAAT